MQDTKGSWLTLAAAAARLGVTVQAVYWRVKMGRLAAVRTDLGWLCWLPDTADAVVDDSATVTA